MQNWLYLTACLDKNRGKKYADLAKRELTPMAKLLTFVMLVKKLNMLPCQFVLHKSAECNHGSKLMQIYSERIFSHFELNSHLVNRLVQNLYKHLYKEDIFWMGRQTLY